MHGPSTEIEFHEVMTDFCILGTLVTNVLYRMDHQLTVAQPDPKSAASESGDMVHSNGNTSRSRLAIAHASRGSLSERVLY